MISTANSQRDAPRRKTSWEETKKKVWGFSSHYRVSKTQTKPSQQVIRRNQQQPRGSEAKGWLN